MTLAVRLASPVGQYPKVYSPDSQPASAVFCDPSGIKMSTVAAIAMSVAVKLIVRAEVEAKRIYVQGAMQQMVS